MRRGRLRAARFGANATGTSAIEFAFVFPVLVVLLLGGTQVILYINAVRKVEQIAASVSEMISQAAPPYGSTTGTVNAADIHFGFDSTLVIFPAILKDAARKGVAWYQDIQVNFASITFTQTKTNCTGNDLSGCYTPAVLWTNVGVPGGGYRPCLPAQTAVDDTARSTRLTLPRSIFGPGSVIAIDVSFVPTFAARLLPPLTISRSVFVQPRYASVIQFDTTATDGIVTPCS